MKAALTAGLIFQSWLASLVMPRQWRKFEKRTSKLFKRFGVDIFHTIDVKRTDKDFRRWSVDRKIEFLDEFQHIINETLELGFASILKQEDYDYYRNLQCPRKARKDSKYTIMFRGCLAAAIDGAGSIQEWRYGKEPKLNIVLESGHDNAPDAMRLYNFFKDRVPSSALSGLTFESKGDSLSLAAADLFAYPIRRHEFFVL
jgi:hypothetical protein